jgi:signal peptidase II
MAALLGTAVAVFGLDHLTKWLVTRHLALGKQWPSSGPVTIHLIHNRGAAFGLFPELQTVFLVVAAIVSLYIIVAGPRFARGIPAQITLGAILGGAVANAVDRFTQGYVVDFVDLQRWPVFNLADSCIVVGIIVAVFTLGQRQPARENAA